jgi:hypothetical protein
LAGAPLTNSWPLRCRYTQFASDLFDISNERATAATARPPALNHLLHGRVPKLRRVPPI